MNMIDPTYHDRDIQDEDGPKSPIKEPTPPVDPTPGEEEPLDPKGDNKSDAKSASASA